MEEDFPPPPSATPGTVIAGKYRVDGILGDGSMGVVLEATHLQSGQPVAIKLLRLEWCTPELEARFEREARVAAQLPAEHIARVTDAGHTEAREPFLVMERLIGRDLSAEISQRRGPFPIDEAADIILQATAGVAAAHAAALVHRDLKPANLFLVDRPGGVNVKVLDFGLSKEPLREGDTALTRTTTTFGTPQYMSPEQIQSAKHVDARSDQHALAMILYELIAGQPPYDSSTVTNLMIAIATEPVPSVRALRPEVPPELEAVISRALAKHPDDRFPDVLAFARALAPFAGARAAAGLQNVADALDPRSAALAVAPTVPPPPGPAPPAQPPRFDEDSRTLLRIPNLLAEIEAEGQRDTVAASAKPARPSRRRALIIGGGALALLVAAGLGTWLLFGPSSPSSEDEPEDTAEPAASAAPSAVPSGSASSASSAPSASASTAPTTAPRPRQYPRKPSTPRHPSKPRGKAP